MMPVLLDLLKNKKMLNNTKNNYHSVISKSGFEFIETIQKFKYLQNYEKK